MPTAARAQRDAFLRKLASPPAVMGILNLTPDSFSDARRFGNVDVAGETRKFGKNLLRLETMRG